MIQLNTLLDVVDNSGARIVKCIGISKGRIASLGDIIMVTVIQCVKRAKGPKILPGAINTRVVKQHEVHPALIIRTRKGFKRANGIYVKHGDNAVILVKKQHKKYQPMGTRVFGPIAGEVGLAIKNYPQLHRLLTQPSNQI